MEIRKVGVIGAGVMGSGIAAHIANAGIPVVLLDIVPEGTSDRNAIAAGAVQRMLKIEPAPFMHPRNARLVQPGNLEDDLQALADCDWIVEAVIERLDIKQDLYARVDTVRKPGSVVSSNTSTIPLKELVAQMPAAFRADFMITHFFNPPRYMRLLEVVDGDATRAEAAASIRRFGDQVLGKGVVECKDTPGFIGNRIGVYWLQCAVAEAIAMGVSVEEADAVVGSPMGIPRTGVFGLLDLVGIDLMPHILVSMDRTLGADDAFREYFDTPPLLHRMIEDGYIGRKGKGGFYRLQRSGSKRVKEAIDLATGDYREADRPRLACVAAAREGGLRALVTQDERASRYAWRVLAKTLGYAASLVPEIADDVVAVDAAMRLGYNWRYGPFELIDRLGAAWFAERLQADGMPVPALIERAGEGGFYRERAGVREALALAGGYEAVARAEGIELLEDIKRSREPLARNGSASLWDVGDDVLCLEFHSKMNAMDPDILAMARKALEVVPGRFQGLVIYNEAENFSVGANLGLVLFAANTAAWDQIEEMVKAGQDTYAALRDAPFPVVGAPAGMALGGGCEILLHCDALCAHAETYMGLVETGVGLIPGWGGCSEMLSRAFAQPRRPGGAMPAISRVFETLSMGTVSRSAQQARDLLFLREGDRIVMNRDRLLGEAKSMLRELAGDYRPRDAVAMELPGPAARAALAMVVDGFVKSGKASVHDQRVAMALAEVLSGGDTDITESVDRRHVLELERRHFMGLVREPLTLARIEHTLETGKPLRN
jgi:3-hydroxyacyl-CoA dehydrogenase